MLPILIYLATRIWNLLLIPPFVDELLYIRWTNQIANNWKNIWISMVEDGQPPLFFWLGAISKKITHLDTLLVLRILSITAGLATLILVIRIGTKLFNQSVGNWLGLIYTVFPMFLWYDRLGMRESIITLAGLILINGLINRLLFNQKNASYQIVLGFFLGILTKGTAILFLPCIITTFLFYWKKIKFNKHDLLSIVFIFASLIIIFLLGNSIISKGESFLSVSRDLFSNIYPNLYSTVSWVLEYSTLPILLLGMISTVFLFLQKNKLSLLLATIIITVVSIEILFAKIYFPRYFLWTLVIWLIPIAYGADWVFKRRLGWIMMSLLLIPVIHFDYKIIFDPTTSPLPAIERWQYITGWPSGYGISKIADITNKYPVDILIVEDNEACKTGISYYGKNNFTQVRLKDINKAKVSMVGGGNVYACLNKESQIDWDGEVIEIAKVERPGNESSIRLYELKAKDVN